MREDEYIPVTEETKQDLHELKEPGQSYDALLTALIQHWRRQDLEARLQELDAAARYALTPLEDV